MSEEKKTYQLSKAVTGLRFMQKAAEKHKLKDEEKLAEKAQDEVGTAPRAGRPRRRAAAGRQASAARPRRTGPPRVAPAGALDGRGVAIPVPGHLGG